VSAGERARHVSGQPHTRTALEQRAQWLDAQAALPASGRRGAQADIHHRARAGGQNSIDERAPSAARRDYVALASLVGYGREQYEQLDPRHRREARLRIDRELAQRRQRLGGGIPGTSSAQDRIRVAAPTAHERTRRGESADASTPRPVVESAVMRDAHEVARRRKRQLGYDR
jgi:hypothetical protein